MYDTVYLLKPHRTLCKSSEKRNYKLREKNKLREICVQIKRNHLGGGVITEWNAECGKT